MRFFFTIYRITVTRSLDHLRKQKRQKRWGIVKRIFGAEEEQKIKTHTFEHPGILLENKEKAVLLFKAIASLPEKQKTAFTLYNIEGLNYKEIAEIMDLSLSAVESLIHRAKQGLKKDLAKYYRS